MKSGKPTDSRKDDMPSYVPSKDVRIEFYLDISPKQLTFELEQMTATLVLRNTGPNKICFRIHPPRSANYKVLPPAGFVDVRKSTEVQVQRLKSIQNTDQLTVEFTGDTGVEEAENAFYDNYLDSDKVPVPISAAGAQETGCTVS